jgi:hypothetical protein
VFLWFLNDSCVMFGENLLNWWVRCGCLFEWKCALGEKEIGIWLVSDSVKGKVKLNLDAREGSVFKLCIDL